VGYFTIIYRDESSRVSNVVQVVRGYTPSFHIPLGAMGDVMYLNIVPHDTRITVQDVYLNMPLPWVFRWERVVILTLIAIFIWLWKKYGFSRIPLNPERKWQRCVNSGIVLVFVGLLLFVTVFSTDFGFIPGSGNPWQWNPVRPGHNNINDLLVEALLMGQLNLDIEPHPSLLYAAHPHSFAYRLANWVHAPWDHVFFEGQFFSYFGVTSVVVLALPYYFIRGQHLSAAMTTFIFSAMGAIGVYLLWKELARKYLKDMPYMLFLAGLFAALFGSNLMLMVVRPMQYEIALASGMAFSALGLYFILRAVRGDSYKEVKARYLFFGGACLALAVGCRPTMIFSSLLVPVFLWPVIRSCFPLSQFFKGNGPEKPTAARLAVLRSVLAIGIPYALIGAALAWYNFARFGSLFEFGASYQLTAENVAVVTHTGVLNNLRRVFDGIFAFLFSVFHMQPRSFPYVQVIHAAPIFTGHMPRLATIGAFMLPVTWFLPAVYFIRRKEAVKKAMPVVLGMAGIGVFIAVLATVLIGVIARYTVDFFWLIMLASLVCMGLVHREARVLGEGLAKAVRLLAFAAVGVSCFILFNWGMVGENNFIWASNPVVFRFIADFFMFL